MTDRYTKIVLTIIAAALTGIFIQNALRPARAVGDDIQKVQICDTVGCAELSPLLTAGGRTRRGLLVDPER
jgi:hypothetical protein